MQKTLDNLKSQIVGFRVGTISPAFIDTVKIPYYGQQMPIKQVAFTSTTKAGISVVPHDASLVGQITNILKSSGFNAYVFSKTSVVVSVPPISGEEKQRVFGQIRKLGEEAKIAIRNIRKLLKDEIKTLSKDERSKSEKDIQQLTDFYIGEVDKIVSNKIDTL